MITKPATAVENSGNRKLGGASATYVAQGSCPTTCAFLGAGCYAESGKSGIATRQLARAAAGATPAALARAEAAAIDTLSGRRPLRLHVVGDCATTAAARTVAAAAERYTARAGAPVWTYTHAWRKVSRASWGPVAVRASVERLEDIPIARARGYAAAIVVDAHPADGRAWTAPDGTRVIPCAEQTRGRTCTDCRMCWERPDVTIAFAAHGPASAAVRVSLG